MPTGISGASKAKNVPLLPRIQGLRSHYEDITLRGNKLVDQIGDVILDGTLVRKIGGASELKLEIEDKGAKLLNSSLLAADYHLMLDGLGFSYVAYERSGILSPLVLTHEAQIVHRLRQLHGPHKAFRDEMTRAEFAKARVMELKNPRPRFICPELHKKQPVKSEREARNRTQESKEERGHGIGSGVRLEIKEGTKASLAQKQLGNMALEIAESLQAPIVVRVALIAALIDENEMSGPNVLQAEPFIAEGASTSAVDEITGFLTGKNWTQQPGGAIGFANHNPKATPGEIATAVQGNRDGSGPYDAVTPQARKWVEAFGGSGGSLTELQPQRFPFEEKKTENHWKCITGLAVAVNWRCFESAGWIYFIAEPTLLESHQRMTISDSTPGILDTQIKGDSGKPHDEVTVTAMVKEWAAPPGSVVALEHHGPADGLYLVDRIESPLAIRESVATIQLKRPSKPKKEPAPPTKTKSVTFGGTGNGPKNIEAMVSEIDRIDAEHRPYQTPGARGTPPPATGDYDCSGFVSRVMYIGGYTNTSLVSGPMMTMYEAGPGENFYYATNAVHVIGRIRAPSGWKWFGTSGTNPGGGAGWLSDADAAAALESVLASHVLRHPKGA